MPETTAAKMRPELEAIAPERIKRLPVDPERGYPVPWFVAWLNGRPEFRVADTQKYARAHAQHLCWVCGDVLGRRRWFVIGPMCTINRISAEPPNHLECAVFSVRACPFLSKPQMERRDGCLVDGRPVPADAAYFGGAGLPHNPGVTVLYLPMDYERRRDGQGGYLFKLGEPLDVNWWTLGRRATRAEAAAGLAAGTDRLRALATENGPAAVREFERLSRRAQDFLPEE